jgi:hypothetical protein
MGIGGIDWGTALMQGLGSGLSGGARNIQDMFQLQMQQQMARQRQQWEMEQMKQSHANEMQQMETAHGYRGTEEEQKQANTLAQMDKEKDITMLRDTIARNQMLINASMDVWRAEKTAQIQMKEQKYLEGMRFGFTEKEHKLIMDRLKSAAKDNTGQFMDAMSGAMLKSVTALAGLDELESNNAKELDFMAGNYSKGEDRLGTKYTPDQMKTLGSKLDILKKKAESYSRARDVISGQIEQYKTVGVSGQGVVHPDRQVFLRQQLKIMDDKLRERGANRNALGPQGVAALLDYSLKDAGDPKGLTPADQVFLNAILAEEKTSKSPGRSR